MIDVYSHPDEMYKFGLLGGVIKTNVPEYNPTTKSFPQLERYVAETRLSSDLNLLDDSLEPSNHRFAPHFGLQGARDKSRNPESPIAKLIKSYENNDGHGQIDLTKLSRKNDDARVVVDDDGFYRGCTTQHQYTNRITEVIMWNSSLMKRFENDRVKPFDDHLVDTPWSGSVILPDHNMQRLSATTTTTANRATRASARTTRGGTQLEQHTELPSNGRCPSNRRGRGKSLSIKVPSLSFLEIFED